MNRRISNAKELMQKNGFAVHHTHFRCPDVILLRLDILLFLGSFSLRFVVPNGLPAPFPHVRGIAASVTGGCQLLT